MASPESTREVVNWTLAESKEMDVMHMIVFRTLSGDEVQVKDSGEQEACLAAVSSDRNSASFFIRGVRYFARSIEKVRYVELNQSPKVKRGRPKTRGYGKHT
jgi:hypothetical protein